MKTCGFKALQSTNTGGLKPCKIKDTDKTNRID